MFVGHLAVGFAGKAITPKINVLWLLIAAMWADILFTLFVLFGLESMRLEPGITQVNPMNFDDYPWSHSLAMDCVWAMILAAAICLLTRDVRASAVVGIAVLSHWVLDAISHIPDMPIAPSSAMRVGFGLWRSKLATIVVEGGMWIVALAVYRLTTKPRDAIGRWGFWAYAAFVSALYVANLFGPPPPNVRVVAWVNLSVMLLILWPAWFDSHRAKT
jgi:hypothetical protein